MTSPSSTNLLRPRIAILSIVGFWLFYFAIVTLRSLMTGYADQAQMLGLRAIVAVVSMGITWVVYIVLRRFTGGALRYGIIAAILLSIPAAILYSATNWYVFSAYQARMMAAEKQAARSATVPATAAIPDEADIPEVPEVPEVPEIPETPEVPEAPAAASAEDARAFAAEMRRAAVEIRNAAMQARVEGLKAAAEGRRAAAQARADAARARQMAQMDRMVVTGSADADAKGKTKIVANKGQPVGEEEHGRLALIADNAVNGYFFFAAWAALYLALSYAAAVGAAERAAAGYRAAAQSAELRALRYQVNPHFLFNTLNSLSSLVMTGKPDAAERMIISLSTFFRTSLTGDPTEDVPLHEEIRLQRLYLDIEAVRFPSRLIVDIVLPDELRNACVPGLILQPLVENAIKYGVSRATRPVTVRISAMERKGELVLYVIDNGDPLPASERGQGTGVGLRNVCDRLAARFGDSATCEWLASPAGGFGVTLTLPLSRDGC